jgi:hypothetical protein
VVDYLSRRGESIASALDPIGEENLSLSKKIRRMALREGSWRSGEVLRQVADDFFPMPEVPFGYWYDRRLRGGDEAPAEG